jgi:hypothetical protein
MSAPDPANLVATALNYCTKIADSFEAKRAEARRRTACAQRTEQQIRAIVRDEIHLFCTGGDDE